MPATFPICALIQLYQEADGSLDESRPELLARIRDLAEQMDLSYTLANVEGLAVRSNEGLARIQQIVKNLATSPGSTRPS